MTIPSEPLTSSEQEQPKAKSNRFQTCLKQLKKLNPGRYLMKPQPRAHFFLKTEASIQAQESPYIKGRMAWDELYGSTVTQLENSYSLMALLCIVIVGLGWVCWHIASQSQIKPYIVEVASNGQVITGVKAQSFNESHIPQSVIEGALYKFIVNARGITGDPDMDQDNIYAAQAVTTGNAFNTLSSFYQQNNPLILDRLNKVTIQVLYEIQRTPNTYELAWRETTTSLNDQPLSQKNFIADLTYKLGDVKDVRYNPLGIYITDLTWTEQI